MGWDRQVPEVASVMHRGCFIDIRHEVWDGTGLGF